MIDVTVVLHAHGDPERLRACLRALGAQTLPASRVEVIVVGAGAVHARALASELPGLVEPGDATTGGMGAAMALGRHAVRGRYCVLLDDQVTAPPNLLAAHLAAHGGQDDRVVIGPVSLAVGRVAHPLTRYLFEQWGVARLRDSCDGPAATVVDCERGNVSVSCAALRGVDAWPDKLTHGVYTELVWRLRQGGVRAVLAPDAEAHFVAAPGLRTAIDLAAARGAGAVALYERHPEVLPLLQLGRFGEPSVPERVMRRILCAARVPSLVVAGVVGMVSRGTWSRPWCRFVHDYCYWRGVQQALGNDERWQGLSRGVTMLMYHACGSPGEPASTYVIPLRRFAWQMRWLARRGYNVISLSEYLRCRAEHRLPPAKSVVLTFDDGYVDNLTNATPVLRQHGFPATLFVVTGHVGGSNCWDAAGDLVGRPLVSWAQVRRMVDATWDIGAHTETHCWLSEADSTRLEAELAQPRAALEPVLGHPVTTFAYPGGRHDARSASALARAGYVAACSSHHGANDFGTDPFLLRRAEVRGDASRLRFACAVAFGSARPWARYQYRSVFSWSVDRSPPHSMVE